VPHVVAQLALLPLHSYGEQPGEPAEPAASSVQVPNDPATLQASQLPLHAALQQ
jgi:hypothetical protein